MTSRNGHKKKKLPLILIAGMRGSGKTTLMQRFVAEHEGGPLAVLHLEATDFLFDTGILRSQSIALERSEDAIAGIRLDEKSESWEEKLSKQLKQWAEKARYEAALIEVFQFNELKKILDIAESSKIECEVKNVVYLVDALELWLVLTEYSANTPEGKTKLEKLEANIKLHSELATQFVLHKADVLVGPRLELCRKYLRRIVPDIEWKEASFGELPPGEITGSSETKKVEKNEKTPDFQEETKSFVFRARRPFHPQRLWDLFFKEYPGLSRTKGFIWLATRMEMVGGLSQAGSSYSVGAAGRWWATFPKEEWPQGQARDRVLTNWKEPYGDRRQELVLMAPEEMHEPLSAVLEMALLTDMEMELGPSGWKQFEDPFGDWEQEEATPGAAL